MRQETIRLMAVILLITIAFSFVTPVKAQSSFQLPQSRNDFCTFFAQKVNDPFMERDGKRCSDARYILSRQNQSLLNQYDAEYCTWLSSRTRNPAFASNQDACAEQRRNESLVEAQNPSHPNLVAISKLVSGLPIESLSSRCDWLADKYGSKKVLVEDAHGPPTCDNFEVRQYVVSPTESVADYKAYCATLAKALPTLNPTDVNRFCPDIEKVIAAKRAVAYADDSRSSQELYGWLKVAAIALALAALLAAGYYGFVVLPKKRAQERIRARITMFKTRMEKVLSSAGDTPEKREKSIDAAYDKRDVTLKYSEDGNQFAPSGVFEHLNFELSRSLATMDPSENFAMRVAMQLANRGLVDPEWFFRMRFSLIYGDGKAVVENWECKPAKTNTTPMPDFGAALSVYARVNSFTSSAAVSQALTTLQQLENQMPNDPLVRRLRAMVMGGGGWLTESEVETHSVFNTDLKRPHNLLLGTMAPDKGLYFDGEGSLITVAPPGAGKSQAHVIPNLLLWRGAALVLDVKGELFDKTHAWREANVGPVYRFAPLDPENSHCFNPLTFVRGDRFNVWEDARVLADLFLVKTNDGDNFWDQRARDILTAVIALICYDVPPENRSMDAMHSIVNRVDWTEFLARLANAEGVRSMQEAASTLKKMEDKALDGVLQTLTITLQPWGGERVRHVVRKSDWKPLDLRGNKKPTIYMCLTPGEIDSFSSVMRVFVGMHLRALTAKQPAQEDPFILFMLDELPRLKHMPLIVEALDIGRGFKIKLWMFAQSIGQLEAAYKNARGMIGQCAVQAFMNPSGHDETAQKISELLGERAGVLDAQRRKVLETAEITGPEFKNTVIVFGTSSYPSRVTKVMAWSNPDFKRRMETSSRSDAKDSASA